MEIIIRVDSSAKIGSGHLIRCLTLANELALKNATIHFVCRDLAGNMNWLVKKHGFQILTLPAPEKDVTLAPCKPKHASWLEVSWENDLEDTKRAIASFKTRFDWVIVDCYALDHDWERGIRLFSKKTLVIDDLADRKHDCDILIDQNYFGNGQKRYQNLVPENCWKLIGPKHALIRKKIRNAREFSTIQGKHIARVLIYFGGNDPYDLTGMTLKALSCEEYRHLILWVVVGTNYNFMNALTRQAVKRSKTQIFIQPNGFTELLLKSDICIGAGGTTTWERLCLSMPSIVITTADNQEAPTRELSKTGLINWVGTHNDISIKKIQTGLQNLLISLANLKGPDNYDTMVDGFGALRAAEALIPTDRKDLFLRPAMQEDMALYFSWANDYITRKYALSHEQIPWETHQAFFNEKIQSSSTMMWIIETKLKLPVGQIRFDIYNNFAELDYSLDPIVRGRNWASVLLSLGVKAFKRKKPGIKIIAKAKNKNIPSCAALRRIAVSVDSFGTGITIFNL